MTTKAAEPVVSKDYPGELASPQQVLQLADQYRAAAISLRDMGQRGKPLTWAPFRMAAIHAIELYLNALLLAGGAEPATIRGMRHDLQLRTQAVQGLGLILRTRTVAHLATLHQSREYLVTRYGPELAGTMSQVNRLTATLDELAEKAARRFQEIPAKTSK
ncbi:MAG: hypothetical protein BGO82_11145 [Devosia sp. 67-54]|uniref:hypothetical protein n=1 Tax=unclassified Devosia TaxID=196773 RepID=UPI00095FC0EE|nr:MULTISPECIES: hypothetical protein [unclassified Devosia]OJX15235.1 MAG: hypothetical protein BGO82_11145 [Devosia sp. 67-54]